MPISRDLNRTPPTDTGPFGKLAGAGVAAFYSGIVLYSVADRFMSVDAWWLLVSTILAFLIAEGIASLYDRFTEHLTTDWTVVLEFAAFFALFIGGVSVSNWATSFVANAFNTVGPLAYAAFFALNIFPIMGLYFDFLKRRKQRFANLTK